ncbi:hypothetical protein PhCBS80983_g00392 [Powellomyces hirtus]|uniref:Mitochondrial carrier protein n=1 Tax=Powellomyces hirtus TaxID=109895 RepID=A0A507EER8_9FUNG|nr:hypothetical protein PhCBS80983_g00392 [Powellomyces hirtus]
MSYSSIPSSHPVAVMQQAQSQKQSQPYAPLSTPPPALTPVRVFNSFCAGAIALSTSFAVMHPLDTLKTRMQAAAAAPGAQRGIASSLFTPDTLRTLRRGFLASVIGAGPQGGLRWATYEVCKHHMTKWSPPPPRPPVGAPTQILPSWGFMATSAASAIAGDFVSSIVKVPREVITSRLQTGHYDTASKTKPTAMYAFRAILRQEGPSGLFRGFWSTTLRDWPFMAILFTTYDTLKNIHHHFAVTSRDTIGPHGQIHHHEIPTLKSTLFGGVAGALAAFLTTPFDVIRTRVMTRKDKGKVSMRTIANGIIAEHPRAAYRAFFVGGAARSVWWFCVCSMFFPIYERAKETLDDWSDDRS